MEHVKLESITDSPAFWNDPFSISSYCNSILQSTKKENEEVSIIVSDYNTIPRVSYENRNSINKYCIYLPKLKDFYIEENIQLEDIKLRKAFLKHELAHIIFSEMENYLEHHAESTADIKMLANSLEDVRIENFFGKRFPGANDTFFDVQNKFYKKSKKSIENDKPSMRNLSLYFLYRSKRFEFEDTLPIRIYDAIFEKNKNFLSLNGSEIVELLSKIKDDFQSEISSQKEEVEEYNDSIPDKEKVTISKDDLDNNFDQSDSEENSSGELEIEDDLPKTKNPNMNSNEEDSEEDEEDSENSEDEEDSEDSESSNSEDSENEDSESNNSEDSDSDEEEEEEEDFDEDEDSNGSSGKRDGSSNEEDEDNSGFESSNFSDMIKEQLASNLKKEEENISDFNSDNEDKDFDLESLKDKIDENRDAINILKLIDFVDDHFINEVDSNSSGIIDFLKYNNSKMKNQGSKIVDVSRYINLISNRPKKGSKSKKFKQQQTKQNFSSTRTIYSSIASKNNKNIISLTNFFKLKFQGKEKSKRFYNKEIGDLNNESLYKLFNVQEDNKIFSNIEKSLVTKDDISFLLDFSGSMSGNKMRCLFESLVVLNEVFTKIGIPYNIFSFTGRNPHFYFKYNSLSEKTILSRAFNSKYFNISNDKHNDDTLYISGLSGINDITFCLINRNSKPEERKKIINFLLNNAFNRNNDRFWNDVLSGGGTPEIQSVIALYNNLPKQKLFLINDGEYDKINFFGKEISKVSGVDSFNIRKIDFYKFGLNLITGREVHIKNTSEKNLLINAIRIIQNNLSYSNLGSCHLNNFFNNTGDYQTDMDIVNDIMYDYKKLLSNIIYNSDFFQNKDCNIVNNYFIIDKKYNPRNDISTFKIQIKNNLPSFKLKVNNKIISFSKQEFYTDKIVSSDLFLDKDEITEISDIYKILCFFDLRGIGDLIKRNDITQYTYLDLINKMRNNGWGVFGIGIESDYGKNYVGESNFTFVKNYGDIRQNLEKKIKKIIN